MTQREPSPDRPDVVWTGVLRDLREEIHKVAATDVSVLVQGETGVGKEIVARELHAASPRAREPFVKVHCAALPHALLESELFGYEKGAFTGAWRSKPGRFELADGGTIFLDEIAEMSDALQAKLLQVLQDRSFARLGSNRERRVDVRVVCATRADLERMIEQGRFRRDLYFRIHVVRLEVPPLRERHAEIPKLFDTLVERYAARYGRPVPPVGSDLLAAFARHRFPGNVRELENMARRLVVFQDPELLLRELRAHTIRARKGADGLERTLHQLEESAGRVPLREVGRRAASEAEQVLVERALAITDWNRRKTARLLGVSYSTLLQKMRDLGIREGPHS